MIDFSDVTSTKNVTPDSPETLHVVRQVRQNMVQQWAQERPAFRFPYRKVAAGVLAAASIAALAYGGSELNRRGSGAGEVNVGVSGSPGQAGPAFSYVPQQQLRITDSDPNMVITAAGKTSPEFFAALADQAKTLGGHNAMPGQYVRTTCFMATGPSGRPLADMTDHQTTQVYRSVPSPQHIVGYRDSKNPQPGQQSYTVLGKEMTMGWNHNQAAAPTLDLLGMSAQELYTFARSAKGAKQYEGLEWDQKTPVANLVSLLWLSAASGAEHAKILQAIGQAPRLEVRDAGKDSLGRAQVFVRNPQASSVEGWYLDATTGAWIGSAEVAKESTWLRTSTSMVYSTCVDHAVAGPPVSR